MSGLRLEVSKAEGGTLVRLRGTIDENFNRQAFVSVSRGAVIFDLAGVDRITSFGVREWVNALKDLDSTYYGFVGCRPSMMTQFNIVSNFAGDGDVISFYSPYACDACGKEFQVLVDVRDHYLQVQSLEAPAAPCPECSGDAEFDDLPDIYFSFVAGRPLPKLPDAAAQLLRAEVAPTKPRLRLKKEVIGRVTGLWLSGPLTKGVRFKRLLDGLEGVAVIVLAGVTEADEGGVEALRSLAAIQNVECWLARVPEHLHHQLTTLALELPDLRVASVLATQRCTKCSAESSSEIDVARATNLSAGLAQALTCTHCQHSGAIVIEPRTMLAINEFLGSEIDEDVANYLLNRPGTEPPDTTEHRSLKTYEFIRPIGFGGMGEVFLARQRGAAGFEKRVVVKRILESHARSPEFVEMFMREAKLAARISHPNVVTTLDFGTERGSYFIAMEYVDGWDLRTLFNALVRNRMRIPVPVVCRILSDVCAGLHAAHTCTTSDGQVAGIVHRAVCPGNILVSRSGDAKVTDFGVARTATKDGGVDTSIVGKIPYMAPEQMRGDVDVRADVYSVGIILYMLLAGDHPYRVGGPNSLTYKHDNPPKPLGPRCPDATPTLEALVHMAISARADDRQATALDLRLELERELMGNRHAMTSNHVGAWLESLPLDAKRSPRLSSGDGRG